MKHLARSPVAAVLLATFLALTAWAPDAAAGKKIFSVSDPRGDDYCDGSLVFPESADWEPGDMDLVRFSAYKASGGVEFEAVFARPVKEPIRRPLDGYIMLTDLAKLGFYTFNIDVYVDIDREPGSGRLVTLPGRLAEVDPDHAWEKVVCLTPRPDTARSQLRTIRVADSKREMKAEQGTVRSEDVSRAREQIRLDMSEDTFFPTRIRISGPKIKFFVPDSFFGQTPTADWSYVVAVSGADILTGLQTREVSGGIARIPFSGLMILPIQAGGSRFTFGSREPDVEMLPPLVDIVVPEGREQKEVLRSFDVLAGQPARLPGVVPAAR